MRRLTLILSDLYLSADSTGIERPQIHDLPSLDWLLRFAAVERIGDWRRWLLSQAGGERAGMRLADFAAGERTGPPFWIATPVHLEARLDHVRLVDRGLLHLDAEERAAWCREFARVFGPGYQLHAGGARGFFLSGIAPVGVQTRDPARLIGGDIGDALPATDARELRMLWTEIEMWLHGAENNAARERAGLRRVSALWLWGNEEGARVATPPERGEFSFHGGDPLIEGFARRSGQVATSTTFSRLTPGPRHAVAEFAPLSGGDRESLAALERDWFAPARAALLRGEIAEITVIANDKAFVTRRRSGLKLWRARRSWLESLA